MDSSFSLALFLGVPTGSPSSSPCRGSAAERGRVLQADTTALSRWGFKSYTFFKTGKISQCVCSCHFRAAPGAPAWAAAAGAAGGRSTSSSSSSSSTSSSSTNNTGSRTEKKKQKQKNFSSLFMKDCYSCGSLMKLRKISNAEEDEKDIYQQQYRSIYLDERVPNFQPVMRKRQFRVCHKLRGVFVRKAYQNTKNCATPCLRNLSRIPIYFPGVSSAFYFFKKNNSVRYVTAGEDGR